MKQRLMVGLGLLCVGLGTVGIFVPGLPTTVFLLVASWLFARSSPTLRRRLNDHPQLGAFLRRAQSGPMPVRARVVSLIGTWGGIGASCLLVDSRGAFLTPLLVSLGIIGTAAILWLSHFGNRVPDCGSHALHLDT